MSKKTEQQTLTPEQANDAVNKLATGQETPVTLDEAFEIMENTDTTGMKDLSREYFKFEKKGQYLFLIQGLSKAEFNGRETDVVEFSTRDHKQWINGDTMLVDAARKLTTIPCFVKVDFVEERKSPQGSYKMLKVYTFPANIQK